MYSLPPICHPSIPPMKALTIPLQPHFRNLSTPPTTSDGVIIASWSAGDPFPKLHHSVCFLEQLLVPILAGWLLREQTHRLRNRVQHERVLLRNTLESNTCGREKKEAGLDRVRK
jgi:hypothetical protein